VLHRPLEQAFVNELLIQDTRCLLPSAFCLLPTAYCSVPIKGGCFFEPESLYWMVILY
jgi:hypothetical protein